MENIINPQLIPKRSTIDSCGYDLYVPTETGWDISTDFVTYDTGVRFTGKEIPFIRADMAWFAMIVPRSSMGFKHGLEFSNTVCIIDQDYRDTIKVNMRANHRFTLGYGSRFAQLIFLPYGILKDEIEPTARRNGGIGSTDNDNQTKLEGFF